MSQGSAQREWRRALPPLPYNTAVLQPPTNLQIIQDVLIAPTDLELQSSSDLRHCRYVVCSNRRSGRAGNFPEDETNWQIEFLGDLKEFLINKTRPVAFGDFVQKVRFECGVSARANTIDVWLTSQLGSPAQRVASPFSQKQWVDALLRYQELFLQDPHNRWAVWFYIHFDNPVRAVPSENTLRSLASAAADQTVGHFAAAGGLSPRQLPTFPSRDAFSVDMTVSPGAVPFPPPLALSARPRARAADDISSDTHSVGIQPLSARANTPDSLKHKVQKGKKAVSQLLGAVTKAPGTATAAAASPDVPSVLTSLASEIEAGDYLTGLLPSTNGSPRNQLQVDSDQAGMFEHYCQYLPHLDPKQRHANRSIRLRHTDLALTPHQFTRAFQILFQDKETGLAGGFLASEMGTGKSHILIAAVAIRALLFESVRRVEREWNATEELADPSRPSKSARQPARKLDHLPRCAPRRRGLRCPSQALRGYDVQCFCEPDGITRRTVSRLKPGAALIHVPASAMPGWIQMLEDAKLSRIAYNVMVLYSGPPLSSRLQPNLGVLRSKKFQDWSMGAVLPPCHPGGLISSSHEVDWLPQPPVLPNHVGMALETYIFVTPHNSTQLLDLYRWNLNDLSPAPQASTFPDGGLYALPCGLTLIDECHKVLHAESLPMQMARMHRHIRPSIRPTTESRVVSDVWFVSGTPFGSSMHDMAAAIAFLAPDRADDAAALLEAYEAIEAPWTKTTARARAVSIFETLFARVFDQLVIRDETDTTFMGHLITDISKVRPQYVSVQTPANHLQAVQAILNTKVTVIPDRPYIETLQTLAQNTELLYLLSTFPSAARLIQETPDTPFLDLDTRRAIRSGRSTAGEALADNTVLRSLAERLARRPRSPKLQFILDELERMKKDTAPRPQAPQDASRAGSGVHADKDWTLKKLVVITPTLFTAVMLYMILARYHPGSGPLLYHQDLKQGQKAEVLRRFNSFRRRDGPWRVFVAPAAVAAEALNLQAANRLILTSPLLSVHQEGQALARVNRVGQTLRVHLTTLVFEDGPVDRVIVAHRAKARFRSDPFNVSQALDVATGPEDAETPQVEAEEDLYGQ